MALELNDVEVSDVQIKEREGQYGPFNTLHLMIGGTEYSKIMKKDEVLDVASGDTLKTLKYSEGKGKSGTFYNILQYERQKGTTSAATSTGRPMSSVAKDVQKTNTPSTNTAASSNTNKTTTTFASKDISMEVSGIIQALIQAGVAIENLEHRTKSVLLLKRRIAKELEETGTVYND